MTDIAPNASKIQAEGAQTLAPTSEGMLQSMGGGINWLHDENADRISEIGTINSTLTTMQATDTSLQNQINTANSNISSNTSAISTINSRLSTDTKTVVTNSYAQIASVPSATDNIVGVGVLQDGLGNIRAIYMINSAPGVLQMTGNLFTVSVLDPSYDFTFLTVDNGTNRLLYIRVRQVQSV